MKLEQELRSRLGEHPKENMDFLIRLTSNAINDYPLSDNLEIGVQYVYKTYIYSKLIYQEALKARRLRIMTKEAASLMRDHFYSQKEIIKNLGKLLDLNFPL